MEERNMIEQAVKKSKLNRIKSTGLASKMVNDHWEKVFNAKQNGKLFIAYDGYTLPPFFQTVGVEWAHCEAFSALLAARHQEIPPQQETERRGYNRELCSYARTHIGCEFFSMYGYPDDYPEDNYAKNLPAPNAIVSVYPQCNTGLLWDDFNYRFFGIDKVKKFNVHLPVLTGAGTEPPYYMRGPQFEESVEYVKMQLVELVKFLEDFTGKTFDWDKFKEIMGYIKKAATLRVEGMNLANAAKPCPASFFDWSATIAPISFCEAGPELVNVYQSMKDEIEDRIAKGIGSVENERYRLYWDGIMNWNKLGALAKKFAGFDACVVNGRYTHEGFWQHPELIDLDDPLTGYAANLCGCPANHSILPLIELTERLIKEGNIDGMILHAARTCRSMSNPQVMLENAAATRFGVSTTSFEGDVTDESFYQDELLNKRFETLLETIDARRANTGSN